VEMSFSMIRARIGETPDSKERRRMSRFPVEIDARVREGFERDPRRLPLVERDRAGRPRDGA